MSEIVSMEDLLAEVATLKKLKDENANLKRVVNSMINERTQREAMIAGLTAQWNVIVVMGQVSESESNQFVLTQSEQTYTVEALTHPCGNGDWVMVVGCLSLETSYDDPASMVISAAKIEGILAAPRTDSDASTLEVVKLG